MQRSRLAFWLAFLLAGGVGALAASLAKSLGAPAAITIGVVAALGALLVIGAVLTKFGR